jgi:protein-disulfide isomerase
MSNHLKFPVSSNDHIQGNSNATLELVEYGDYQCSYCGHAFPIIRNIQQTLSNELKFVFRNFPLSEVHPDAMNAAVAAEAAALQNRFWEMHDILYENQVRLDVEALFFYAKTIGLDLELFKNDIQKDALVTRVETDFETGIRSGVNGTPSFFINGEKYDGDWEESPLLTYLKSQLK